MSIYRSSCRVTERVAMKRAYARGVSVDDISKQLRVTPAIVTDVIEGKWDAKEKAQTLAKMELNKQDLLGKAEAETNKIAQIAAAAAAAITGQTVVVDQAALRAQIEAEVRAEIAGESKPLAVEEISQQQKSANTRKANAEAAALAEQDATPSSE